MKTPCEESKHYWKCLAVAGHYKCTKCNAKSIFDRQYHGHRLISEEIINPLTKEKK